MKRAFDFIMSLLGIILLSPVILVLVVLVKLTSKGPILFKQKRIGKDNKEFYIISPYKLIQNNSKYYVIGYFDKRPDSLSLYRLDRMRLVRNHKSKYFEGEQFDVEQIDNPINMYISGEKEDLEISFDQSIIKEVVDKFGQDNRVTKDYENRYHLIVKDVLINEGLIGWLMMLQDKITVIKPYSLQEEMKKRIEKTLKQYQ